MIIKDFSDFLKENYKKNNNSTIELLSIWIKNKIENPPNTLIDKILQKEIYIAKNCFTSKKNEFFLIGKSNSGRILLNSLYNFALSFEQQEISREIHNIKYFNVN